MSTHNAMRVINPHVGFLANAEVRDLLKQLRDGQDFVLTEMRDAHDEVREEDESVPEFNEEGERRRIMSDQQRIFLAKTLQYLEDPILSRSHNADMPQLKAYLENIDAHAKPETFTKAEKLQLANNPPESAVEMWALIEGVGDRINEANLREDDENEVLQAIVDITDQHFEPRAPPALHMNGDVGGEEEGEKGDEEQGAAEEGEEEDDEQAEDDEMAEDNELVMPTGQSAARDPGLDIDETPES